MKLKMVKDDVKCSLAFILRPEEDKEVIAQESKRGTCYQVVENNEAEAERVSRIPKAQRAVALWRAGWDIEAIAADVNCSLLKVALFVQCSERYPKYFSKIEPIEAEDSELDNEELY